MIEEPEKEISAPGSEFDEADFEEKVKPYDCVQIEKVCTVTSDDGKGNLDMEYTKFYVSEDVYKRQRWGITPDELHEHAMKNSNKLMPARVRDMESILRAGFGDLESLDLDPLGGKMCIRDRG